MPRILFIKAAVYYSAREGLINFDRKGAQVVEKVIICTTRSFLDHLFLSVVILLFFTSTLLLAMPSNDINPIIPGFSPDPSIIRIHNDFFLVNSTFHMFPGLPIYTSKDLISWKHIGSYFS
jgi:hypothetical protein